MVLILWCLRKRGHGFKSHPTDWEKPEIKPRAPGLQGICYQRRYSLVCGREPWLLPVLVACIYVFVVLFPGAPEGSTDSGSGFKASQRTGHGFKSHPTDWDKPESNLQPLVYKA